MRSHTNSNSNKNPRSTPIEQQLIQLIETTMKNHCKKNHRSDRTDSFQTQNENKRNTMFVVLSKKIQGQLSPCL